MTVGATSSTPLTASSCSPSDSCITALENAKKMEELGGCTRMSAPTPSTRFPHSETTPDVRPTTRSTRITEWRWRSHSEDFAAGGQRCCPKTFARGKTVRRRFLSSSPTGFVFYHSHFVMVKIAGGGASRVPNLRKNISGLLSFQHKC